MSGLEVRCKADVGQTSGIRKRATGERAIDTKPAPN
jgi:hypothetical protein